MAPVIVLAEVARARRQRAVRALHAACRRILAASVVAARAELATAPPDEQDVRTTRLRKLEELAAYAAALG
ncbi:MAG: hypothetical protein ACREQL_10130 [Candidatus Binatia bacterium]